MLNTEVENSNETIISFLKTSLKEKGLFLSDIDRNTSVTYSTLNRTFNDKRDFSPLELVEVLNYLYAKDEARDVIDKFYPNQSALTSLYSDIKSEKQIEAKQEKYFLSPKTFALANLIDLGYFKNQAEIKEAYGNVGLNILTKMNNDKIVTITPRGEIISNLERTKPSFGTIRSQIANATNYHKDSNCGKFKNFLYFGTQLISKEKRTYLYKLTRLFRDLVSSIIHDDKIHNEKYKELTTLINSYESFEGKEKTEPVYYSILFDDFRSTDQNERILQ